MSLNDHPLLVAPRPVRLAAAHSRTLRIVHEPDGPDDPKLPARIQSESSSPRASPRSGLSSEALEEFLAILRPAMFPPSSPVLRSRRNGALSLPAFGVAYMAKSKIDPTLPKPDHSSVPLPDDPDLVRKTPTYSPEPISDHLAANWDVLSPEIASRWHAQLLSSPISRMQTRNPFPRCVPHDLSLSPIRSSPTTTSSPTSPAAIPLPAPSPDESFEIF